MGSMIFPADLHGWFRDFHEFPGFPMWKTRSQRGAAAPLTFCAAASMGSVTHRVITPRIGRIGGSFQFVSGLPPGWSHVIPWKWLDNPGNKLEMESICRNTGSNKGLKSR